MAAGGATASTKRADNPPGEWNHYDIRVRNRTVNAWLNGEPILRDATLSAMPLQGPIGLKIEGGPVWFRNVEIRRMTAARVMPPKPSSKFKVQSSKPGAARNTNRRPKP